MTAAVRPDSTAPVSPRGAGSDAVLLAAFARDGDHSAFGELVRRHGPLAHGVCRRVLADSSDADDAYQAALIVLARRAGQVRDPGRLGPWLYGVALRCAKRAKGLTAARHARERPLPELPTRPMASDDWHDVRPVLDAEIERLPEKLRAALVLCELQGVDRAVAAARLGVPPGTLSSRLARAKDALRAGLVRRGVTLTAAGLTTALTEAQAGAAGPPAAAVPSAATLTLVHMETAVFVSSGLLKMLLLALLTAAGLTAAGVALLPADPPPKPAAADAAEEKAKLVGEWEVVSVKLAGRAVEGQERDKMVGSKVVFTAADVRIGGTLRYTLAPETTPKGIDLDVVDGPPAERKTIPGVYRLDGDTLTLHLPSPKASPMTRPADFESKPDGGALLIVLKRVKPDPVKAERAKLVGVWDISSVKLDGVAQEDNGVLGKGPVRFTADGLDIPGWPGTVQFSVDPSATPRRLDVTQTYANGDRRTTVGTYALDGDTLTWHLATPDEAKPGIGRPEDLTPAKPGTGHLLVVLKRAAPSVETEKAKLLGAWSIVGGNTVEGNKFGGRPNTVTFTADRVDLLYGLGRPFTLDPSTNPKRIDLTVAEGVRGKTMPGVYKLDGDALTVHMAGEPVAASGVDAARPKDFTPVIGSWLLVLRRGKPDPATAEKAKLLGDWRVVSGVSRGRQADVRMNPAFFAGWTFAADALTLRGTVVPYRVDTAASPKRLDLPSADGTVLPAVYKLDGDTLTVHSPGKAVAAADSDAARPKDFAPRPGADADIVVLKRDTPAAAAERKKLAGTWRITESFGDGGRYPHWLDHPMTFTDDTVLFMGAPCTYTVDPTATPKRLDFPGSEVTGRTLPGVYKLDGDTLTVHIPREESKVAGADAIRPKDFTPRPAGRGAWLFVLKRENPTVSGERLKFQGLWTVASATLDGDAKAGRTAFGPAPDALIGSETINTGSRLLQFSLDPGRTPRHIDLSAPAMSDPPTRVTQPGIYQFDGDTLTLHVATPASKAGRPADFKPAAPGTGHLLVVLRLKRDSVLMPPGVKPAAPPESSPPAPSGTLTGHVRVGGKPATSGRVTVYFGPGNTKFVGARLVGGTFGIERMPAGAYEVTVEAEVDGVKRTHTEAVAAQRLADGPVRVVRDFDLK